MLPEDEGFIIYYCTQSNWGREQNTGVYDTREEAQGVIDQLPHHDSAGNPVEYSIEPLSPESEMSMTTPATITERGNEFSDEVLRHLQSRRAAQTAGTNHT